MATIFINLLLAFAWCAITGSFAFINLAFGFVLGSLSLLLIREELHSLSHFRRFFGAVTLALTFLVELVKSSVNVTMIVLSPSRTLRPAIIAYPLDLKTDAEITLLANLITLTPGTLSMDVSDDRHTLFVHAIDAPVPDDIVRDIKATFEWRIHKVFHA